MSIIESRSGCGRAGTAGTSIGRPRAMSSRGQRAVVGELRRDLGAVRVHAVGERPQAGLVRVERRRDLALVDAAVGVRDRDRPDEQERGAAAGPGLEVRELGVRDGAVRVRERVAHRRHEDPVPQRHGPDRPGGEEQWELGHVGKLVVDTVYVTGGH